MYVEKKTIFRGCQKNHKFRMASVIAKFQFTTRKDAYERLIISHISYTYGTADIQCLSQE